ncbi:hypothetical protein Tsp_04753 [Trichinella spiralis]|uniref:hypothetical protein n=1 Tax=Trichinella spiralis TaxID=6334 RepID=UPI0001EFDBF0|nr:hypothetical protein Tsp_04753 [Trichinella spiralis]
MARCTYFDATPPVKSATKSRLTHMPCVPTSPTLPPPKHEHLKTFKRALTYHSANYNCSVSLLQHCVTAAVAVTVKRKSRSKGRNNVGANARKIITLGDLKCWSSVNERRNILVSVTHLLKRCAQDTGRTKTRRIPQRKIAATDNRGSDTGSCALTVKGDKQPTTHWTPC